MKILLIFFILFTLVCCEEESNSTNTTNNNSANTQNQVNDNTSMIDMIKADIEEINAAIESINEQIQNLLDEIDNINNTTPPIPVPVTVPVCCDVNPQPRLLIIDVNEVVLGEVLGFLGDSPTKPWTAIEINGKKYVFTVGKDNFIRGSTDRTYFENNDCTGQAYIRKLNVDDSFVAVVGTVAPADANSDPVNDTLYEPDLNSLVNDTYNSSWDSETMSCSSTTNTEDLYEANQVTNLPTLFEPPYTIQ